MLFFSLWVHRPINWPCLSSGSDIHRKILFFFYYLTYINQLYLRSERSLHLIPARFFFWVAFLNISKKVGKAFTLFCPTYSASYLLKFNFGSDLFELPLAERITAQVVYTLWVLKHFSQGVLKHVVLIKV